MEKNIKLKNYLIKITCNDLDRLEINVYDVLGDIIETLIIFNDENDDDETNDGYDGPNNGDDGPKNGPDDFDDYIGSFMAKINLN